MNAKNVETCPRFIHTRLERNGSWYDVIVVVVVVEVAAVLEALVYPFSRGVRSFSNLFEKRNWHLSLYIYLCHVTGSKSWIVVASMG